VNAPDPVRAIARGLLDALAPALDASAPPVARQTARDVAQVMGLDGLDEVLAELQRVHGTARPADVEHVVSRLVRLSERAAAEESAAAFHDADRELAALARALRETEWSGAGGATVAVYPASVALADLPLQASPDLDRARLAAPVASALRAALEWIGADEALLVQAAVHDSALTLTCPVAREGGLGPAGAVLAACEGSLGPEADGRWTLRVPLHVERPSFLLLRVGHVPVALPWHSVARLRMLSPAAWSELGEPVLDPPTPLQPSTEERPGALVALGLQRAWFVADRVVWRIAANADIAHERGPLGASASVIGVENGERYWVLEPAWLLRGVPPVSVAPPSLRPRPAPAPQPAPAVTAPVAEPVVEEASGESLADAVARAIEALRPERALSESRRMARPVLATGAPPPSLEMPRPAAVAPPALHEEPRPAPASREMPRPAPAETPAIVHAQLTVLRPEDVVPHHAPPGAPASRPASLPPVAAPHPSPLPSGSRPAVVTARRALVADDSLVARIFLARLLERRGYVVETVGDGETMWEELRRGPWSLVCADVTMPDWHGRAHLERLLDFRAACRAPFRLIALTRDAAEEREAAEAGAALYLRKPFDPRALDDLLGR
jgi:CheY-like chemotaxis protein